MTNGVTIDWDWGNKSEPYFVLNYVDEFFDYDHNIGKLRWTSDSDAFSRLPLQIRQRFNPSDVAGMVRYNRDYELQLGNTIHPALQFIWEKCTGHRCNRVMTIKPRTLDKVFRIDELCLIPNSLKKTPKRRAMSQIVVSWCYDSDRFTVVDVDTGYNKKVLSYHGDIESALEALDNPVVSFL